MRNKGFTLVELLAVVVIITLLSLLTVTSITKVVKSSKEDLYNNQIELIKSSAETWGADNIDKLPDAGECKYITVLDLKEYGLLDSKLMDSRTNKPISDNIKIKITSSNTGYGTLSTKYEINPSSVVGCTPVYSPACTFTDSNSNSSIDLGDVVTCGTESFYVIENENDRLSMLSKFPLNVGDSRYSEETELLQSDVHSSNNSIVYRPVKFSDTNYWKYNESNQYVYDKKFSLIGIYLEDYKTYLKDKLNVRVIDVSLMNYNLAVVLGYNGSNELTFDSSLTWTSGYYWLGFATSSTEVVAAAGTKLAKVKYNDSTYYGVRPVVEILERDIDRG